jgi:AbrB family looped-hinge helix DNA binding protein
MEEPEVAVVGTKGQIVIPRQIRADLNIRPKTKLAVYRRGDKLVVTKLAIPSLGEELKALFKEIDNQFKERRRPTQKEILEEIRAYRKERRSTRVA